MQRERTGQEWDKKTIREEIEERAEQFPVIPASGVSALILMLLRLLYERQLAVPLAAPVAAAWIVRGSSSPVETLSIMLPVTFVASLTVWMLLRR